MRRDAVKAPLPMTGSFAERAYEAVDAVYRSESRRILATLIRLLGDFELAEEALHDAVTAALEQWPEDGGSLTRADPSAEAIRLGRLLDKLLPEPEVAGLLALMLLHESRRAARTSPAGELVLLDDQDRELWNREQIAEGSALVARAEPSPLVELNRAVAVAMRDGPLAGLKLVDAILARGDLAHYHLAHAARADICRRLGKTAEARASYERALALARQDPERRFLERRLGALQG